MANKFNEKIRFYDYHVNYHRKVSIDTLTYMLHSHKDVDIANNMWVDTVTRYLGN